MIHVRLSPIQWTESGGYALANPVTVAGLRYNKTAQANVVTEEIAA